MYFHDPGTRQSKELAPGITTRTFWGENMLVSAVELEADKPLPEHSHPHEQAGIVIEGSLTLTIGGETQTLTAGQVFIVPGDVPHSAVTGSDGARVVDIFCPVREDLKY